MYYSLEGLWEAQLKDGSCYPMMLPGTLDENRIGHRDLGANQWHPDDDLGNGEKDFDPDAPVATRFTRKYTYEGPVKISRKISYTPPEGKRVFLEAERTRCLRLLVDGKEVPPFGETSISTPCVFEVTGLLGGDRELTLIVDNSYPGLPYDDIVYSSAATDETQTNWNGVLGYLRLRVEEPVFLQSVRVYPKKEGLTVRVDIASDRSWQGTLRLDSTALKETAQKQVSGNAGILSAEFSGLPVADNAARWDEYEGNLQEMKAELFLAETAGTTRKTVNFGIRTFADNGTGRLAVNGRTIFLRSEANCAEFPEAGHPPMSVEAWTEVLEIYKSYGVNCMRFHSHCPPEAAFEAADRMGMLMQPELSHWNPRDAFVSEESYHYYRTELKQILYHLANHPSFVMLTLGNELQANELGHQRMSALVSMARELDDTRLYANGSNVHYGAIGCDPDSDFYTSQKFFDDDLRGTFAANGEGVDGIQGYINNRYPDAAFSYDESMENLRKVYKKPVFSFEVGQFEVLPDFDELEQFHGISDPANLRLIRDKVRRQGLETVWKKYVEATGELSRIGYREEIEAAMRTRQLSGISLLGLQDFPGQGTALVGMLNSHLEPKPFAFAQPEKFHAFFRDQLPLVKLPCYTFETGEILQASVEVANFGKTALAGPVFWSLEGEKIQKSGQLSGKDTVVEKFPAGCLTEAGVLEISLSEIKEPQRLNLSVMVQGISNSYPVWVYPPCRPVCPEGIYETELFDDEAKAVLARGGKVYLTPQADKEHLPVSIRTQFTTDFWSVGTFSKQEGGMGQLIDEKHPLFKKFPTEFHTNWQWWPMASQRAVILPRTMKCIITEMDSYAYLRPMAQLFECRCGGGRLLFSSMGLQNLRQYPEGRALLLAIYEYMESDSFMPEQEMMPEEIEALVR